MTSFYDDNKAIRSDILRAAQKMEMFDLLYSRAGWEQKEQGYIRRGLVVNITSKKAKLLTAETTVIF